VATDGEAALGVAAEFRPEVVFLDLGMPGMNGYETARRLRDEVGLAGAAVVALTGWAGEADRERTRAAGFAYHLAKPPDPAEVAALLATLSPAA
jgi:CheY-like chemotaxis protein